MYNLLEQTIQYRQYGTRRQDDDGHNERNRLWRKLSHTDGQRGKSIARKRGIFLVVFLHRF